MAGGLGAVKDRVTGGLRRQRDRRPWLDHLVRGYQRYRATNGDHLAAAVTYFSFLAIFPLILLGVSVAAFVLVRQPEQIVELQRLIADNIPGELGQQVAESVNSVIENRRAIGIIGLGGVALAGLGWIGNLRTALQIVWSSEKADEGAVKARLNDLLVLVGLGLGIVVSVLLTVGGTAATEALVELLGLDGVFGMGTLVRVIGILLALAADTLIFAWLFVRLPRRPVRYRTVLRGALFAAVGYEILKIVGTFFLTRVTGSPTYGVFASAIGLLIWINLVSRFLLFAAAWTATGKQPGAPEDGTDPPEPAAPVSAADRPADRRGGRPGSARRDAGSGAAAGGRQRSLPGRRAARRRAEPDRGGRRAGGRGCRPGGHRGDGGPAAAAPPPRSE